MDGPLFAQGQLFLFESDVRYITQDLKIFYKLSHVQSEDEHMSNSSCLKFSSCLFIAFD